MSEQLAWLAGLFDGEGHIGRYAKRNTLYMEICQASPDGQVPEVLVKAKEFSGLRVGLN